MDAASDRRDEQQTCIMPQLSLRRGHAANEFHKAAFGALEDHRVGGTDDGEDVVEIGKPLVLRPPDSSPRER